MFDISGPSEGHTRGPPRIVEPFQQQKQRRASLRSATNITHTHSSHRRRTTSTGTRTTQSDDHEDEVEVANDVDDDVEITKVNDRLRYPCDVTGELLRLQRPRTKEKKVNPALVQFINSAPDELEASRLLSELKGSQAQTIMLEDRVRSLTQQVNLTEVELNQLRLENVTLRNKVAELEGDKARLQQRCNSFEVVIACQTQKSLDELEATARTQAAQASNDPRRAFTPSMVQHYAQISNLYDVIQGLRKNIRDEENLELRPAPARSDPIESTPDTSTRSRQRRTKSPQIPESKQQGEEDTALSVSRSHPTQPQS